MTDCDNCIDESISFNPDRKLKFFLKIIGKKVNRFCSLYCLNEWLYENEQEIIKIEGEEEWVIGY